MLSIKQWRAKNEATGEPITTPAQQIEPDERDWKFYRTQVQGKAKQYLGWLTGELHTPGMPQDQDLAGKLTLARKGFIVQEIMDALGLNLQDTITVTTKIKNAMAKRQSAERSMSQPLTPETPASPMPKPPPATSATPTPGSGAMKPPMNPGKI